jgi:RNA polymerase sporulation-specific sigma factor
MNNQSSFQNSSVIALLQSAQGGDQKAFEELLKRYTPLIDSLTGRFFSSNAFSVQDREDLRQEALVAFYYALKHFNTAQENVQFGLYAKECIQNRLISHLRSLKHQNKILLMETEPAISFESEIADPSLHLVEQEAYTDLCNRVSKILSDYENRIWWIYLSGRTAKEVATLLGTSERSVQNAIYRIRKKLRSELPYS